MLLLFDGVCVYRVFLLLIVPYMNNRFSSEVDLYGRIERLAQEWKSMCEDVLKHKAQWPMIHTSSRHQTTYNLQHGFCMNTN